MPCTTRMLSYTPNPYEYSTLESGTDASSMGRTSPLREKKSNSIFSGSLYGITTTMKVLGIETSCDDTGVCLIDAEGSFPGRTGGTSFRYAVLGNALSSQVAVHAPYGGVFPDLAKREHAKNLVPMLELALDKANALEKGLTMSFSGHRKSLEEDLARDPGFYEELAEFLQ